MALRRRRGLATTRPVPGRVVVRLAHLLLLLGAGLALQRRSGASTEGLSTSLIGVGRLRWRVNVGEPAYPGVSGVRSDGRRTRSWGLLSRASPLRRSGRACGLISLRVDIGRLRSRGRRATVGTTRAEKLEASLDVRVARVKLCSTLVCVQSISDLVVAALVLCLC
jgi:hypothetical protein